MSGAEVSSGPTLDLVGALLEQSTGLVFDAGRRPVLVAAVRERMAQVGAVEAQEYLGLLRSSGPAGRGELGVLLDEVIVGETSFFRTPPQMVALRQEVLPELARRAGEHRRGLVVWSAGCSTGQEAYTLGVLLAEMLAEMDAAGQVVPAPVRVLGTDLSARAVRRARGGRYGPRELVGLAPRVRERWFQRSSDGEVTVVPEIAAMVDFAVHNLVVDPPPLVRGTVDLIVCRNVTIYFRREAAAALARRFHDILRPGGCLLLGPAETLWQLSGDFSLHQVGAAFVYRKDPPDVAAPPASQRPGRRSGPPAAMTTLPRTGAMDALLPVRQALDSGRYRR
ncbi:MAG: CheR family methyltransferase, partial [Actinomycetes bacterium]